MNRDRMIDRLEEQIEETNDPEERRDLEQEIRDIERDDYDEDEWRGVGYEEGYDRGWI